MTLTVRLFPVIIIIVRMHQLGHRPLELCELKYVLCALSALWMFTRLACVSVLMGISDCVVGLLQVIADIDNDGVDELIVAASYFFDRE